MAAGPDAAGSRVATESLPLGPQLGTAAGVEQYSTQHHRHTQ
jgi:hypothetical protein